MAVFLGIDIGTSGTKTLAIDANGKILAEATEAHPCYHPKPLWSEQDPEDWWQTTIKTIRSVVAKANLNPDSVKAIGLSGQMHGAVFLDKANKVIRPAILWNDQRTAAECEEIERSVGGRANLIKLVANPALTGFTAPKILWLRNSEPANFERLHKVLLPKDEIRRRLTAVYATDVSDASGMLLLDVGKREWSKELLTKLDLDGDLFAPCYESPEITGQLTSQAAELLGLTTNCLVVAGAGDCAAGAIGTGIVTTGAVSTSTGTSGVVFVHSDNLEIDPSGRLHTFCHAVPGKWHMMGVHLASGGSLQWFRNQLCQGETELAKAAKIDVYEKLGQEAAKVPIGSEGLFFLPYLSGERTPHADADARGCFIGLTLAHSRGHMVRAIMEGVAYSLRDSLEIVKELGVPVEQIRASGGGAQSQIWRQIQADVFGHNVVTLNAEEGAAYGVALLAAVGAGAYKNIEEACNATIKVNKETRFNPEATKYYNSAFPLYQRLYQSLKGDFKQIAKLERERGKAVPSVAAR
jgi:xylulokinase